MSLPVWSHPVAAITDEERQSRLSRLRERMQAEGITATLLGPTESLRYFTGLVWHLSERLLGAVVTEDKLTYIVPGFERSRVESLPHLPGEIAVVGSILMWWLYFDHGLEQGHHRIVHSQTPCPQQLHLCAHSHRGRHYRWRGGR